MRITSGVFTRNFLYNLESKTSRLMQLQDQLSSGRRITRPSEDPTGTVTMMRLSTAMAEMEQYMRNIDDARGWLEQAETAFLNTVETLHRSMQLVVQGTNDTLGSGERYAIGAELEQLANHIWELANTKHGDNYLFSGYETRTQPFPVPHDYAGDDRQISRDIGPGLNLVVNFSGEDVFGGPEGVVNVMFEIAEQMKSNDVSQLDGSIERLQDNLDHLLTRTADLGGRIQRLDFVENRFQDSMVNMNQLQSRIADADLAEVMVQLRTEEAAYQAALSAGARIMQTSLLDFIR